MTAAPSMPVFARDIDFHHAPTAPRHTATASRRWRQEISGACAAWRCRVTSWVPRVASGRYRRARDRASVPPTLNLDNPDESLDTPHVAARRRYRRDVELVRVRRHHACLVLAS
jgi:hypothetical protein